jgi:hypothetical protein
LEQVPKLFYRNTPLVVFIQKMGRGYIFMKTKIHVNQHVIKKNRKEGLNDPVFTVKTYKENRYAHKVDVLGPSVLVYSPDKPLSCGAHVWIETEAEVICDA